jgi:hypothetical protein
MQHRSPLSPPPRVSPSVVCDGMRGAREVAGHGAVGAVRARQHALLTTRGAGRVVGPAHGGPAGLWRAVGADAARAVSGTNGRGGFLHLFGVAAALHCRVQLLQDAILRRHLRARRVGRSLAG